MELVKDGVKINYRRPNFADAQLILGEINTGNMDLKDNSKNWDFIIIAKVSSCIGFLIESIEVDDKKISYSELMDDPEKADVTQMLAAEVVSRVMDFALKKKRQ